MTTAGMHDNGGPLSKTLSAPAYSGEVICTPPLSRLMAEAPAVSRRRIVVGLVTHAGRIEVLDWWSAND